MSVLLQISDPHFGAERPHVVEALIGLVRALAPELVVMSGDITQRARSRQFARAAAFVKRLDGHPLLVIPGNHEVPLFDVLTRFANPYREYRRVFGDDFEPRHVGADCLVLAVNTTRYYRHTDGEISAEQRARVAAELERASPEQVRVVVMHHPVVVPREGEVHNVAHGSEAAVRDWAAAGADVILAGHIHLPFVIPLHEAMRPLPRALWAVNAGTAVSNRTRRDAGNSVNVLRIASGTKGASPTCAVEPWGFSEASGEFVRTAEIPLSLGAPATLG